MYTTIPYPFIHQWTLRLFPSPATLLLNTPSLLDQSACTTATLSLVNEAQYLLINRSSVLELQRQLSTR